MHHRDVTFNLGSAKVFSPAIFEMCSLMTEIVATDYYMYFYLSELFLLTAIIQLIHLRAS